MNPEAHGKLALQELVEVVKQDPGCEEAWFFTGEAARGEVQVSGRRSGIRPRRR